MYVYIHYIYAHTYVTYTYICYIHTLHVHTYVHTLHVRTYMYVCSSMSTGILLSWGSVGWRKRVEYISGHNTYMYTYALHILY